MSCPTPRPSSTATVYRGFLPTLVSPGGVPVPGNGTVDAQNYYETISQAPGTYYIYDATNVRLADLTLSYTFPALCSRTSPTSHSRSPARTSG